MNPPPPITTSAVMLLLALGWFGAGCASPSGGSSAPKPGSGIAEYRKVTREAHEAVAATVKSLEALARPSTHTAPTQSALEDFDRTSSKLELTSIKARARAEAIVARGQAYFDEWQQQLTEVTDPTKARAEEERYALLRAQFENVRHRSGEVREEFQPFMAKLREFRATLDTAPGPGSKSSQEELDELTTHGRRVLQTLESVSAALDEAETQLRK